MSNQPESMRQALMSFQNQEKELEQNLDRTISRLLQNAGPSAYNDPNMGKIVQLGQDIIGQIH